MLLGQVFELGVAAEGAKEDLLRVLGVLILAEDRSLALEEQSFESQR